MKTIVKEGYGIALNGQLLRLYASHDDYMGPNYELENTNDEESPIWVTDDVQVADWVRRNRGSRNSSLTSAPFNPWGKPAPHETVRDSRAGKQDQLKVVKVKITVEVEDIDADTKFLSIDDVTAARIAEKQRSKLNKTTKADYIRHYQNEGEALKKKGGDYPLEFYQAVIRRNKMLTNDL